MDNPLTTRRILFVDDDASLLSVYQHALGGRFQLDTAISGEEAIRLMAENGPYAVIVADMRMPCMDGIQLLARVGETWPDTIRIMFTGDPDPQTTLEAINKGHVFSFVIKPASSQALADTLEAALDQFTIAQTERDVLERTLTGAVRVLTDLLASVNPEAMGRARKIKEEVHRFLITLGGKGNWEYEIAASLAGIGYLTLPPGVLACHWNQEDLQPNEAEMVRRVPEAGAELIANIPRLEGVAKIILYQAKNFDGSGFPSDAVMGESIPAGARILRAISDLSDLQERGLPTDQAMDLLLSRKERYDPKVLSALQKQVLNKPKKEPAPSVIPSAANSNPRFHEITLEQLRAGYLLVEDVRTTDGLLIFAAGQQITATKLQMIRNFAKLSSIAEPIKVDYLG